MSTLLLLLDVGASAQGEEVPANAFRNEAGEPFRNEAGNYFTEDG